MSEPVVTTAPAVSAPPAMFDHDPEGARAAEITRRITAQHDWYDRHAQLSSRWYFVVKVAQLLLAAGVPVAVSVHAPIALTGSLGAAIVVLEGVQQLFQFHEMWIRYRLMAAALAKERYLFVARAGDYATDPDPIRLVALRTEMLASAETNSWAQTSQGSGPKSPDPLPG